MTTHKHLAHQYAEGPPPLYPAERDLAERIAIAQAREIARRHNLRRLQLRELIDQTEERTS